MKYPLIHRLALGILRALFVKKVDGIKNLPTKGPYIIATNHASYIDAPLIRAALYAYTKQRIHFVAWKKLKKTILAEEIKHEGGIFENGSIKKLTDLLENKHIVGIYPEGRRTLNGEIQKVTHTGTGVIAALSRAPIIPIKTIGTYELWPPQQKFPHVHKTIEFKIGKSVCFKGKKTHKNYLLFGNQVMKIINKL
jgi:1-acyl-sn-glycerol-3-phosphate acyltransferase